MKIVFFTNLDCCQRDVHTLNQEPWDHIPSIGSRIGFDRYELEVKTINYPAPHPARLVREPRPVRVELHIPSWFIGSILDWEERLKRRFA